ncbi:hypothetical protein KM043_013025 [Ampulex compressa]|nr:hypothetical protein KM043_013025 [Ampulex compressa]
MPKGGHRKAVRKIHVMDDAADITGIDTGPICWQRRQAERRRYAEFLVHLYASPETHLRLTWPCCHSRGCGTTSATCRLFTRGGVIIKGQPGGRSGRITIV